MIHGIQPSHIQKRDALRYIAFLMYKLYLKQGEIDISSVLSSLDERLGSLDENNVIENETFDKKDVFTKKPFIAQSPESREDMKRQAEEWLQALVSLRHSIALNSRTLFL